MSELIPNPQPGPGRWSTAPQGPFAPVDVDPAQPAEFVVRYESFADPTASTAEPGAEVRDEPVPYEDGGAGEADGEEAPEGPGTRGQLGGLGAATARALLALSWAIGRASYQHPRWALVVVLSVAVLGATALTRPSKSTPPASIAGEASKEPPKPDDPPASPDAEKPPAPGPEDPALAQAGSAGVPASDKKDEPAKPENKEAGGQPPVETPATVAVAAPKPGTADEPTVAPVQAGPEKPSAPAAAPPPETDPAIVSPLVGAPAAPAPAPAPPTPATVAAVTARAPTAPGGPSELSALPQLPVDGTKPPIDPKTTAAVPLPAVAPKPDDKLPVARTPEVAPVPLPTAGSGPPAPVEAGTGESRPGPKPETTPGGASAPLPVVTPAPGPEMPPTLPATEPPPAGGPGAPTPSGITPIPVSLPQSTGPVAPEKPPVPASTPEPAPPVTPIEEPAKDHPGPPTGPAVPPEKAPQPTAPPETVQPPADTMPTLPTAVGAEDRPASPVSSPDPGAKVKGIRPGPDELPGPGSGATSPGPGPEIPAGPANTGPVAPGADPVPIAPQATHEGGRLDPSPRAAEEPRPATEKLPVDGPPKGDAGQEKEAPAAGIAPKKEEAPGHEGPETRPAVTPVPEEPTRVKSPAAGEAPPPASIMESPAPAAFPVVPERPSAPPREGVTPRPVAERPSHPTADPDLIGSGWVRVEKKGRLSPEMIEDRSGPLADDRRGQGPSADLRSRVDGAKTVPVPERLEAAGGPDAARSAPPARGPASEPAAAPAPDRPRVDSTIHVVERGENFWTISRLYYGSARYYRALWKANARKHPNIEQIHINDVIEIPAVEDLDPAYVDRTHRAPVVRRNPDRGAEPDLGPDPGRSGSVPTSGTALTREDRPSARRPDRPAPELDLPVGDLEPDDWPARIGRVGRAESSRPKPKGSYEEGRTRREPSPDRPVYKVRDYDTLRSIARDFLGDPHRADEVYDLNRDVIEDPARLAAGTLLELPEDADIRRITAGERARGRH